MDKLNNNYYILILLFLLFISIMINIIQYYVSYSRMGLDDLYNNFEYNKPDSKRLITEVKMESDKGHCNITIERSKDKKKVNSKGSEEMDCEKYNYDDTEPISNFTKQLINEDV